MNVKERKGRFKNIEHVVKSNELDFHLANRILIDVLRWSALNCALNKLGNNLSEDEAIFYSCGKGGPMRHLP